ncbi:MAG: hypothetical protein KIG69_07180 [Eubacteriales bacterium]|nr:hypothetical protein [Eubacteriales bacterium]
MIIRNASVTVGNSVRSSYKREINNPAARLNGFAAGLYYLCRLVVLDRE